MGRTECRVAQRFAAGHDRQGSPLEVVEVWIRGPRSCPECSECPDVEYWLVEREPSRVQLLVAAGLACMQWGGGGLAVGPNVATYTYTGSGAPIAGVLPTKTLRLSPLAIESQTVGGEPVAAPALPTSRDHAVLDYR